MLITIPNSECVQSRASAVAAEVAFLLDKECTEEVY
jgi:hypothetical protein